MSVDVNEVNYGFHWHHLPEIYDALLAQELANDRLASCQVYQPGMGRSETARVKRAQARLRELFPQRFSNMPETLVCAECGKAEKAVDHMIEKVKAENIGDHSVESWTFQTVAPDTVIGACSDAHFVKLKARMREYGAAFIKSEGRIAEIRERRSGSK